MAPRSGVGERDFRALLDAVDPKAYNGSGDFMPTGSLRAIAQLIGCDDVTYQVMDPSRRSVLLQPDDAPDGRLEDTAVAAPAGLMDLFWAGFPTSLACNYPIRTGDHTTVTRLSDFHPRGTRRNALVDAYLTESGIRHELLVPLPPDGTRDERILLFRDSGRDFTQRDVLVMTLLRPHIVTLRRRQRHGPLPELTPRQLQILALVATGRTNGQIARALGVAQATVRKHLENTFERLGVSSRSAAVVKVMPLLEIERDSRDHLTTA